MCPPMVIAGLSIAASVASGVIGYQGQKAAYNAQMEQFKSNAENAASAAGDKYSSTQLRILQEGKAMAQKKFQGNIDQSKAVATAQVAAGEGNVSGVSVDHLTADLMGQGGRYTRALNTNYDITKQHLVAEMDATTNRMQGQINSMPIPEKPNFLAALVGIAGSTIGAVGDYRAANPIT